MGMSCWPLIEHGVERFFILAQDKEEDEISLVEEELANGIEDDDQEEQSKSPNQGSHLRRPQMPKCSDASDAHMKQRALEPLDIDYDTLVVRHRELVKEVEELRQEAAALKIQCEAEEAALRHEVELDPELNQDGVGVELKKLQSEAEAIIHSTTPRHAGDPSEARPFDDAMPE